MLARRLGRRPFVLGLLLLQVGLVVADASLVLLVRPLVVDALVFDGVLKLHLPEGLLFLQLLLPHPTVSERRKQAGDRGHLLPRGGARRRCAGIPVD
jgi:hypothetical protein